MPYRGIRHCRPLEVQRRAQVSTDLDDKLSWLREILEWQSELKDFREFVETLKNKSFNDEVFVFTPKVM